MEQLILNKNVYGKIDKTNTKKKIIIYDNDHVLAFKTSTGFYHFPTYSGPFKTCTLKKLGDILNVSIKKEDLEELIETYKYVKKFIIINNKLKPIIYEHIRKFYIYQMKIDDEVLFSLNNGVDLGYITFEKISIDSILDPQNTHIYSKLIPSTSQLEKIKRLERME